MIIDVDRKLGIENEKTTKHFYSYFSSATAIYSNVDIYVVIREVDNDQINV